MKKDEPPFHPIVPYGSGVLTVHPRGSIFYPLQALYWARSFFETSPQFDRLIRPMLEKTVRTLPIHVHANKIARPVRPPEVRYLLSGRKVNPSHLVELLLREREAQSGIFKDERRIYGDVGDDLWIALRYMSHNQKWRLHAMTDYEFRSAEPVGTLILT